jgi:predicted small lipoprotein YifL
VPGRILVHWTALALVVLVPIGCGRKGPPLPPQVRVADTTRDLEVYQEGREAVLTWSYPDITTAGGPLPDVEAVEVWRATIPAGQEPPDVTSRDRAIRYQLLEAEGELLVSLNEAGIADATLGLKLRYRDDLDVWHEVRGGDDRQVLWYVVRTICCRRRPSEYSNIARIVPRLPPSPPTGLEATPSADGIILTWSPIPATAVLVERKGEDAWRVVTREPVTGDRWRDAGAEQGRAWSYRLRSVKVEDSGRVVGEPGESVTLDFPDIYPPAEPSNVVCLPEAERVRIRWQESADAAWYSVARRVDDGDWESLADRHQQVVFDDGDPPLGTLTYGVRAVDQAENRSDLVTCTALMGSQP